MGPLRLAGVCVAASVALAACRAGTPDFDAARLGIEHDGRTTVVRVAVARSERERQRGLMGVRTLPPNSGMAFEFDRPTSRGFWMKDTLVPLSVAFWDRTGRIVAILDMAPCRRDPCPIYSPRRPYIGAVEVARGFFRLYGIEVGDRVKATVTPA